MKLDTLQQHMAEFILRDANMSKLLTAFKDYDADELVARLNIYRNNTFYSLTEALKDLYPSVLDVIGDDLFGAVAKEYVQARPPAQAAMVDYGHNFPAFVKCHSSLSSLPYIHDLALLDLLYHRSFHAVDDLSIDAAFFASTSIEVLASSRVQPLDSAYLLKSDYAVFDMWQLAQGLIDRTVSADEPQCVLVIRPERKVYLQQIDIGIYLFLTCLEECSNTIGDALAFASEQIESFDPSQAMMFLIQSGFTAKLIGEK